MALVVWGSMSWGVPWTQDGQPSSWAMSQLRVVVRAAATPVVAASEPVISAAAISPAVAIRALLVERIAGEDGLQIGSPYPLG